MARLPALLLLLALFGDVADARTWHVRKDDTGDFKIIQDAVDQAAAGDTIKIGPGRFEEKKPYTSYPPDKWTFDVYVAVGVADLTIIGSGVDQTFIGPPSPIWLSPQQPKIICALSRVDRLVVEDISLENVANGIYRDQGGTLTVRRCTFRGCEAGVVTWSEQGTSVEDCLFLQMGDVGVTAYSPCTGLTVSRCRFADQFGISTTRTKSISVSDCRFQGGNVGCQFASYSTGIIRDCVFTGIANVAIVIATGSVADLWENSVLGGNANLYARDTNTTVTGTGNVFAGGSYSTILVSNCNVTLHGNHILHGVGPSVYLETFLNPPIRTLDMTNNYWGTTSADSIASWIYDGHDNPAIYGYVQFEPFSPGVIRAEQKSLGSVKNLYR